MFSQGVRRCSRQCTARILAAPKRSQHIPQRRYSNAAPTPAPAPPPQSAVAALGALKSDLDRLSPRFDVDASQIEILKSPAEFYDTLKTKIERAKRCIFLSTLYIGKTEHDLIASIRRALHRNRDLKVYFLTDGLRGTREAPEPSCASLLTSLIEEFGPKRVEVRMFHTPNLTGWRKRLIPDRINEGWGLQHMKLYGIDDELIMSGANLSNDYFTNRQDRYHVFRSREITQYFYEVFKVVSSLSYKVTTQAVRGLPGAVVWDWPESNPQPSPLTDPTGYIQTATKLLSPLIRQAPASSTPRKKQNTDTTVYPLLQLTPILKPDTSSELPALSLVLGRLATPAFAHSSWTFTAGYFNMTPDIRALLLATNPARGTVVAASPWANGFYGSKGVSGMLPSAYTHLSRQFLHAVDGAGLGARIALKEWRRGTVNEPGGWTYHAKGVWVTLPGERDPCVSLVGSSNYTKRSYSLDLEANALIVTRNSALMSKLGKEERWLQDYARQVDAGEFERTERRVGLHVRIAMWIVTLVGGAL